MLGVGVAIGVERYKADSDTGADARPRFFLTGGFSGAGRSDGVPDQAKVIFGVLRSGVRKYFRSGYPTMIG